MGGARGGAPPRGARAVILRADVLRAVSLRAVILPRAPNVSFPYWLFERFPARERCPHPPLSACLPIVARTHRGYSRRNFRGWGRRASASIDGVPRIGAIEIEIARVCLMEQI